MPERRTGGKRSDEIRQLAQSNYGQNRGHLYSHVGVSGPTEFARLPLEDQLFWDSWFEEACRRADERDTSLENVMEMF